MTKPPVCQSGETTQIRHFAFQIDTKLNRSQVRASTGIFPISIRFNRTLVLSNRISVMNGTIDNKPTYRRHWSFVVCDAKYLYPLALALLVIGLIAAFYFKDPTQLNRVGSFMIGVGVWMSMRYTLREGINRTKNVADNSPTFPGTNQLNVAYLNNIGFAIGDAHLQVRGFILVILGSLVSSYGDVILMYLFSGVFP